MGKQLKKGRAPPGGNQFSKKVAKQSAETVMEQRCCVHFDKCVDLNKLLKKMKACKEIKCGECKEGVDMKRRSEGKVSSFSCDAAKRAVWLCLECGRYCCGGVGLPTEPQSHVMHHIKMTCHRLVIQCENTRLRWCFACQSLLPFEKEVNGERKDLLLEAVKLIKERSSKICSGEAEAEEDSRSSSSISGEIRGSGYGVRGLVNLGNTCFFNSVLQNLLSLDRLRDRLFKEDQSCGGPLVSSLKKLFTEATSEAGLFNSVINPWDFFGSLCSKAPQFRGYQQHDSHELLRCLLDGLSMEESSLRKKHDADESEKPTLVDYVFGGEVSSTISCLECGHSSKVYEPFLDLSLPVPSKKQTLSQEERSKLSPPTKVLENVADSKDSSEPVSTMTFDNNQVPEIIVTQKDMEEVGSFLCESFGIEVSHNETDLVSQGGVSDNEDRSAKRKDKEPIMQCSKDTALNGIDEAQVWGYPDLEQSSSSANPLADEEVPLLVVDSQVMNMPYKDDKAVAEGKGAKQACSIVRQTFESSTETLMHDNDRSAKPDKEAMQCSKDTASSEISAEIDEAQVWGYPDIGHSFSFAKPCADEEVPLLVADSQGGVSVNDEGSAKQKDKEAIMQCSKDTASSGIDEAQVWGYPANPLANEELPLLVVDSQVMNMPYKDDISYDDKTAAEGKGEKQACSIVRQTFESSTETLMHDNDGSAKPDKEDAQAMQCSKETASSEISEEIDIGHSSSSAKPCADEEVPLLVADSQVLYMPYKDDKTVAEDKGETSSSYVSGHHDQTVDYVDFSWFFKEPDVSCDDKTVRECEDEVSSSLVSSHHGKTVDYAVLNEPDVSCNDKTVKEREGEVTSSLVSSHHGKTVDYAVLNEPDVSCGDKTVKECEGEAPSSFVSSHHGQKIDNADYYWFFEEPEVSKGPAFGPPTKAEVSEAGFMGVSCNSDAEVVLDDSDSPVSVDTCLAMFTKPEILSEDNAWHCENCSKNLKLQRLREKRERFGYGWVYDNGFDECRDDIFNQSFIDFNNWDTIYDDEAVDSEEVVVRRAAIKRVQVNKAPPVLTIHLKRFSQDAQGRLSKLRGHVAFSEFIDLGLYMDMDSRQDEEDQPVYMLAGLVEHSGTMRRGHYVAYIRGDDKERRDSSVWYRASDSFVRQVSFEEVLPSEAYILFYQRI
ncbi:ubiquitin carboxyl-terminal hydrolase 2 [Brassica rapa]|uniref:ubiquitinyl hydrolase 1 n=2 Tax=Brassica campestris TaxID=3711 RepID=M4CMW7_BRACM|nr:ubiquitin carboxyl-terminal hydrolase 2 [Brassica rapa]